jgi:hypothetical protein
MYVHVYIVYISLGLAWTYFPNWKIFDIFFTTYSGIHCGLDDIIKHCILCNISVCYFVWHEIVAYSNTSFKNIKNKNHSKLKTYLEIWYISKIQNIKYFFHIMYVFLPNRKHLTYHYNLRVYRISCLINWHLKIISFRTINLY